MNRVYILLFSFIMLIIFGACEQDSTIYVNNFHNSSRIIYGKIDQRLSFDEERLNNYLKENSVYNIGCRSCFFKIERLSIYNKRNVLKLQQYFKGYKVFGHTILIHTDAENFPIYLSDHSYPIDENFSLPDKIIDSEEALQVLRDRLSSERIKYNSIELGIVTYLPQPLFKYRIKAYVEDRKYESGTFDVDAVSRDVYRFEPAFIPFVVTTINSNGESVDVEISRRPDEYSDTDCAGDYCTVDTTRGKTQIFGAQYIKTFYEIVQATYPGELPPRSMIFSSSDPAVWEGIMPDGAMTRRIEGISAHYAVSKVYDWYSALGLRGNVNQDNGVRVFLEKMAYDPLELNAFWDIYSHSAMVIWVYQPDENTSRSFASSYDVVGHEFTHGVLAAPLSEGGLVELEYSNEGWNNSNESASVHEGISDTMGSLSQGDDNPNWLMGYNGLVDMNGNHRWLRNNSDPFDAEAITWGDKEYRGACSQRLCSKYPPPPTHKESCKMPWDIYDATYVCATTIPYPAWKIKNQIGVEKTSKIYFNVIDKYLQKKERIPSVSQYIYDSCLELYNNSEGECCIVAHALSESKFTIDLRGVICGTDIDAGMDAGDDALVDIPVDDAAEDIFHDISDIDSNDVVDIVDIADDKLPDLITIDDVYYEDSKDKDVADLPNIDILLDYLLEDTATSSDAIYEDILITKDSATESEDLSSGCSCAIFSE